MTPKRVRKASATLRSHFVEDIWVRNAPDTPLHVRAWKAVCRFFYLVGHGFFQDQCIIRAAALTFTTILSVVPFLAVAFSISKGFGLQNTEVIRTLILKMTTGRMEVADKIIEYIDRTNVQALGWIGVAMLLFTVLSLVGTIEKAFNTIWQVNRGRSTWRKISDFLPIIVICPIVLLVASSFNVSLHQQNMIKGLLSIQAIGYLEALFLKITPFILISLAFAFMFAFIPNTKVRFSGALLGGMFAGALWQVAQWAYINWQIGAAKYNAIYGSFAQFPLLLVWIYISWTIVLLGSEVSYAFQNLNAFVKKRFFGNATPFERQKLAVLMMVMLARSFRDARPLPSVEELSDQLMAPSSLVSDLYAVLAKFGYVVPVQGREGEVFAPARSLEDVRVVDIIGVVNMDGDNRSYAAFAKRFGFMETLFDNLGKVVSESEANLTLLECAEKFPAHAIEVPKEEVGETK
ncbi:YihY/virulence factor BrkB family protein [Pseudodesulfovibrio tunisiensis]|uniref:YihY/virulence factor BrkB family protein n=1 Tax=Pseudodesulfovibrio tunisiensis TaxID=463192 RepID=UPI001FB2C45F|nr:YihY/virulence factor BrkB family protein [Pseudodesulfovibrio tunisiensis]